MAHNLKAEELSEEVRDLFSKVIQRHLSEINRYCASRLADALWLATCQELAGMRVTFKAARAFSPEAITASWRNGLSAKQVMAKHKVSKTTAYKYHPSKRSSYVL